MNIKQIFNSKLAKNGLWLYSLQFFNTIIPIITLPYVTRILGAKEYGAFSIALNIITYLQVLVEYGFGMSATREVALSDKKEKSLSTLFSAVLLSRGILLSISIIITGLYCALARLPANQFLCVSILSICLFGYCVQQNWIFQGMQEMKYISIINIVSRSLSTILILVFVKAPNDLLLYCFLYSISPFASGFLGLIVSAYKYGIKLVRITLVDVINELRNGFYVFTTQLSSKVFSAIGITILGFFATEEVVGTFSAIQKIPNIIVMLWMPISQVLYPHISEKMSKSFIDGEKYVLKMQKKFIILFLALILILCVFSKTVVSIAFGKEYLDYYYWIIPLSFWIIFAICNNFWGVQILLASGHDREYGRAFQISVCFTVLLNVLLIWKIKGLGASLAPLLSEILLSVLLIHEIRKLKRGKK